MTDRRRSPFGDLVVSYRKAMNLTQEDLVRRIETPKPGHDRATVSLRTLQNIEQEFAPGERWRLPRASTVAALADAFGLEEGSQAWAEFVAASRIQTHDSAPVAPGHATRIRTPGGAPPPGHRTRHETPPFVPQGREHQLAHLDGAIERLAGGEPGVIFVSAEPGTGKTALITHACRNAVERFPGLVVLWGECASQSSASDPHQPFRQALGLMVGDTESASPAHLVSTANAERIQARVPAAVSAIVDHGRGLAGRFVGTQTLARRLEDGSLDSSTASRLARLLQSPDFDAGPQGTNEQVFRTLARYAAGGPVVLVLEDLHWADVGTAAFVFHLVRRLYQNETPILLVGSYRPSDLQEESTRRVSPVAATVREALRYYSSPVIDLSSAVGGDAGQAFVAAIVESSVANASPGLAQSIFHLTGGLPLFVLALLDWYRIEGLPAAQPPGETAAWRSRSGRVPTRLESALTYLIDRLPPNLQSLLTIASVQGTTFSSEVLQRVTRLTPAELTSELHSELHRRYQVIEPAGVSVTGGVRSHEYRFRHALLRDVLFERLSDFEREHYHAATATAMEDLWRDTGDECAARIAYHFALAGEQRTAAEYALKAGTHALELQEYDLARQQFGYVHGLGIGAASPLLFAHSLIGLGNCGRGDGNLDDARARLLEAIDITRRHRLPLVHAAALTSMAMLDFDAGHMATGTQRLSDAVNTLLAAGDRAEAGRSLYLLSFTLLGIGRYDEASERARQAIALAEELGNEPLLAGATIALANSRLELGHHAEAIAMYEACLPLCEGHNNLHRYAVCWLNIALARVEMGAPEQARAALAPVFDLRDRIPARLIGAAEFDLGLCEEAAGNTGTALAHYEASLDVRYRVGQNALVIDSLAAMARAALDLGRLDAVHRHLIELDDWIGRRGLEGIEHPGRLFVTGVRAWRALGDEDRAREFLEQGIGFLAERADGLRNPEDRRSYLGNVPSHRQLLALAPESELSTSMSGA